METIISCTHLFRFSAWCFIVRPVVSSDTLIPTLFSISQSLKKLALSNASPPDMTTILVSNCINEPSNPATSSSVSCCRFLLSFQISHMTQRQLQALCGIRITIGNAEMRCVRRGLYRWKVCESDGRDMITDLQLSNETARV